MPLAGEVALPVVVVPPVAHLMRKPSQETLQSSSSSPQTPQYLISSSQGVATQDRVFSHYVPNSSIKHSKSDSKDRSQEIL
jgi:hypothetical protein